MYSMTMNPKRKISLLDVVVSLLLLGLVGYVVYRLTTQLNYKWNWGILPQYFFYFDEDAGRWVANILVEGLATTIRLSVWATLLAVVFGAVTGLMRVSARLFWRLIGGSYVELIRNMPPLVLVFIFYFFVSDQIMPLLGVEDFVRSRPDSVKDVLALLFASPQRFTAFVSGVITVALFQGAYITEIVRAGIQSIERGQWEASYALGLSWGQQMRWVILPQALKRVLPPLTNEFINTIKYSAIVSVISIQELTFQGMQIMASTYVTIEVWIIITAIYLIICFSLSMGVRRLEAYLARSEG
jgi:polar amino acid transport system permease protein